MRLRTVSLFFVVCFSNAALAAQTSVSPTPVGRGRGPLARVAYISDEAQNDVYELYGVPVDGSAAAVRLNDALPAGGDVSNVHTIAQVVGERVLYIADQLTNDTLELFSVPDDASAAPVRLNGPLVTGGDVSTFMPAKGRVVFQADATVDNRDELFCASLDGSFAAIPLTPGLDVYRVIQFTRDESLVVFTTTDTIMEFLYVVPTDGSQSPLLLDDTGTPSGFGYSFFDEIEIAPGDLQVVYLVAEDDDEIIMGDLFSARLDGSTPPVQLNPGPRFVVLPFVSRLFRIAPNGERVLYVEEDAGFTEIKLQSVQLDGTGLVNLVADGQVADRRNFRISADGAYAVFASYGGGASLYLSLLDGSMSLVLLDPIAGPIMGLELVPGGTGLVYATGTTSEATRLYSLFVPNQPQELTGSPPAGQGASVSTSPYDALAFTADGSVIFRADLASDQAFELYSVPLDGSEPAQRLHPPFSADRDVLNFRLTPDRRRAVYMADQSANEVFELFSVPIDGSGLPVVLNQAPVSGGDVLSHTKPASSGRLTRIP